MPIIPDAGAQPAAWPSVDLRPSGPGHGGESVPDLAGYVVAVASDRRHAPLATVIAEAGARTQSFQATRTVPQADPVHLAAATDLALRAPADEVVVSSAFGLRTWFAAVRAAGRSDELNQLLAGARLLARDARTADALRELGHREIWSTPANTSEGLFGYLLAQPPGSRVVAQIDEEPILELSATLADRDTDVVEVVTVRTEPPTHRDLLRRLVDHVVRRQVDAVVLTAPSGVEHLLEQADVDGHLDDLLNAALADVLFVCLGPRTAAPLRARGLNPARPEHPVLAEVPEVLAAELSRRATRLVLRGLHIEIRGQAVLVGDCVLPLPAGPMAVLRTLARDPGRVVSPAELRRRVPGWSQVDNHAIEMAVSRLRRHLGGPDMEGVDVVQTVVKRGYRLAV